MTIDEAIEILKICVEDCDRLNEPRTKEASKLGIKALIFYRKLKPLNTGEIQGNFLGETEE